MTCGPFVGLTGMHESACTCLACSCGLRFPKLASVFKKMEQQFHNNDEHKTTMSTRHPKPIMDNNNMNDGLQPQIGHDHDHRRKNERTTQKTQKTNMTSIMSIPAKKETHNQADN